LNSWSPNQRKLIQKKIKTGATTSTVQGKSDIQKKKTEGQNSTQPNQKIFDGVLDHVASSTTLMVALPPFEKYYDKYYKFICRSAATHWWFIKIYPTEMMF
jgi:hypothetical protein